MLDAYSRRGRRWPLLLALLLLLVQPLWAQQTHKKVVLQAFWWDYWNSNYPAGWANYLTDLAPRLKSLGIDAVWIPPTVKNKNATSDVGYSPFDHYDLGDKYQKGATGTRVGTKDELLRLVAVLHANGIEVIQDVVLNHADGAGTSTGAGGQDPDSYAMSSNNGYKTFRYACYGTPLPEAGETSAEYLLRQGRWTKNYPNFHAHAGHNTTSGDMAAPYFGPDFCYGDDGGSDGYGPSTTSSYNPPQSAGYSRDQARSWLVWLKKQTGVDGFRWDAVKHFSYAAQQDWSYNLKYLAGWANGGNAMFNVGEFVGGGGDLDTYVGSVTGQNNGSEFLMGTFDFGLRDGLYSMVSGNGSFNIGNLPGYQQGQRVAQYGSGTSAVYVHRTAPFVNNHDTFRPQLDASGNYTGWNAGSELAPHIDPFDPRLSAAYAAAFAVDGNPQVFFEDLFNIGGTGKRFSHLPTSATDLPLRDDLVNLIWCHQNLHFKDGAYKVRAQQADHLVIERGAKALIGINDNWDTWQETYVDSDFAPGTRLIDYSGANGSYVYVVPQDQRVRINTPPCNGSAAFGRRGYSVWAPEGQGSSNVLPARAAATTQEWELADDLGDQNCQSLGQGGRLPDNSTNQRVVGKIYAQSGQTVTYELYPELSGTGRDLTFGLYDRQGNRLQAATGVGTITGTYTPSSTGWLALKLRNTSSTYTGQRCYVKVTYTAPSAPSALSAPAANTVAIWTGNDNSSDASSCRNWEGGLQPSATTDVLVPAGSSYMPALGSGTLQARSLTVESGATLTLAAGSTLRLAGNLSNNGTLVSNGTVALAGASTQTLGGSGALSFANLTIDNAADVQLLAPVSVTGTLALSNGHLLLGDQNLTLASTATISGADASRYVVTKNRAASGGALVRPAPAGTTLLYPVGTSASYTPLTVLNTGTTAPTVPVRVFGGVLQNGTSGAPHAQASAFVDRTWDISPSTALTAALTFQWNATDENVGFDRSRAAVMHYNGNGSWGSYSTTAVGSSGPYTVTASGVSSFSPFSIGTGGVVLPVTLLDFVAQRRGPATVQLRWATAQEQDNAGFEVEKSMDGRQYRRIGQVAGHGTSTQRQAYLFVDDAATAAAYYRLRQTDTDGKTTYSAPQYVAAGPGSELTIYPNPTTGDVRLDGLPATAQLQLALRTAPGRVVLSTPLLTAAEASAKLSAALRRAAPGLYVLTVEVNGQPQHLKVVKQ
ncbi:alpha-amylase family glycosyl hydrolase [Hymenobacter jeollabukensis]|nr:alpha-amylase family glycosyl hydrolase [Hymenobacter jeollabukensis]